MRSALGLSALLLLGALAGCVSDPGTGPAPVTPTSEPDWAVRALFAGADPDETDRFMPPGHDHMNRSMHKGLSTPNFRILGHEPLLSPYYGQSAGSNHCGDVSAPGGERQLAVLQSHASDVAISIVDVTDRANPRMLGELVLPYVFTYDAAIFADGRYAVIAGNPDLATDKPPTAGDRVPFSATWRTACGEREVESSVDSLPYGYSAILVDLADPTDPKVADAYQYPAGRNVHSISTATVGSTRFVATSGLMALPCTVPSVAGNPLPNPVPCEPRVPRFGNLLSHFDFLTVEETPAGARLVLYLIYTPSDQPHMDPSLLYLHNGHTDALIERHPITNQTIAYLADWDGGLHIIRLDDRGRATPLSSWGQVPSGDDSQMRGNIHSVTPLGVHDGRHLIVVGQEVVGRPAGRPSGQIAILDATDPRSLVRAARWTLPVDVHWPASDGLMFSTHYSAYHNGTLFVGMYHGGVWAVDARKSAWPDLPSLGVFLPDGEPANGVRHPEPGPFVLDLMNLGDGKLLVVDANTGAYTVAFDRDAGDVPPALPWEDNPWIG
jgi:hypothetical protein